MKIAHICTSSLSHKILVDKLAGLKARGMEVHLISSPEGFDERILPPGVRMIFHEMKREISPLHDFRSLVGLYKLLRREKYDLVHTHTAKAGIIGRVAAWMARVPVVIHTTHGLPFYQGQSLFLYGFYWLLEKLGSLFCHAIASQNREDIGKLEKMTVKTLYYEGNGIDLHALDRVKAEISDEALRQLRDELKIGEKPVLLVGARLEPVKNHRDLLEALAYLKGKYMTDFVCLLMGKGPLEEELRRQVSALHLEEEVRFVGYRVNPYPLIQLADIVLLTSEKEGIPRIIMEAMAFRKPVIATDVMGTRELVVSGETGVLTPLHHPVALGEYIYLLLTDPQKRMAFGEAGRHRIEESFTTEVVLDRIEEFYRELIPGNKPTYREVSKI